LPAIAAPAFLAERNSIPIGTAYPGLTTTSSAVAESPLDPLTAI
jgi:hypothetical protein